MKKTNRLLWIIFSISLIVSLGSFFSACLEMTQPSPTPFPFFLYCTAGLLTLASAFVTLAILISRHYRSLKQNKDGKDELTPRRPIHAHGIPS